VEIPLAREQYRFVAIVVADFAVMVTRIDEVIE
jgi:hypothetical protein